MSDGYAMRDPTGEAGSTMRQRLISQVRNIDGVHPRFGA